MPGRDDPGGATKAAFDASPLRKIARAGNVEDDDEGAVGPLAELPRQELRGAVGVGAGDGERIREERRQARRGPDAADERDEPDQQDERPVAQDDFGPALGHDGRVPRAQSVVPPGTEARDLDTERMRRLALVLFTALALFAAPGGAALAASPTLRTALVHTLRGCHVWSIAGTPRPPVTTVRVARGASRRAQDLVPDGLRSHPCSRARRWRSARPASRPGRHGGSRCAGPAPTCCGHGTSRAPSRRACRRWARTTSRC